MSASDDVADLPTTNIKKKQTSQNVDYILT